MSTKHDLTTTQGVEDWAHESVDGYDLEYWDVTADAAKIARAMRLMGVWDNWHNLGWGTDADDEARTIGLYSQLWDAAERPEK